MTFACLSFPANPSPFIIHPRQGFYPLPWKELETPRERWPLLSERTHLKNHLTSFQLGTACEEAPGKEIMNNGEMSAAGHPWTRLLESFLPLLLHVQPREFIVSHPGPLVGKLMNVWPDKQDRQHEFLVMTTSPAQGWRSEGPGACGLAPDLQTLKFQWKRKKNWPFPLWCDERSPGCVQTAFREPVAVTLIPDWRLGVGREAIK